MDKMYHLDLQTLIDFLQGQSAMLSTTVDLPDVQGPCKGYLFLREGTIIECLIQSPDERLLLKGQQAYRALNTKTQWQVRIDRNIELVLRSMLGLQEPQRMAYTAPPSLNAYMPRVMEPLEPYLLKGYTAKQRLMLRTVYAMVNGERTIEQIKAQLSLSPDAVDDALAHLHAIGVIA